MDKTIENDLRAIFETIEISIKLNSGFPISTETSRCRRDGVEIGLKTAASIIANQFNAKKILSEYGNFD